MSLIGIWAKFSLDIFISSLNPMGSNFLPRQVLFLPDKFFRMLFFLLHSIFESLNLLGHPNKFSMT